VLGRERRPTRECVRRKAASFKRLYGDQPAADNYLMRPYTALEASPFSSGDSDTTLRLLAAVVENLFRGVTSGFPLSTDEYRRQPQHHRVNFAVQFNTIDIGVVPVFSCVLIRNLRPSLLTS
jgi:hypothetical protein